MKINELGTEKREGFGRQFYSLRSMRFLDLEVNLVGVYSQALQCFISGDYSSMHLFRNSETHDKVSWKVMLIESGLSAQRPL